MSQRVTLSTKIFLFFINIYNFEQAYHLPIDRKFPQIIPRKVLICHPLDVQKNKIRFSLKVFKYQFIELHQKNLLNIKKTIIYIYKAYFRKDWLIFKFQKPNIVKKQGIPSKISPCEKCLKKSSKKAFEKKWFSALYFFIWKFSKSQWLLTWTSKI